MVTNYTLGKPSEELSTDLLKELYKTDDFFGLFDGFRSMVQGYLFNETTFKTISKDEYLHGYPEARLQFVFNNTGDYFYGMEPDMPDSVTPVLTDSTSLSRD